LTSTELGVIDLGFPLAYVLYVLATAIKASSREELEAAIEAAQNFVAA